MDGLGAAARDLWITSATKMRLLADSRTPALDIHVDTRAGVVTLFGMVPSQEARAAAEADAHTVSGVQRVVNDLQVVARAEQAAVQARDEELARAVKQAFEPRRSGHQRGGEERRRAADGDRGHRGTAPEAAMAARAVPGVRAVKDDLRLATATPA
jgi:hypothetical protein